MTTEERLPLDEHEIKHNDIIRKNGAECTLFLKKNDEFPLEKPCKVLLVGSGARDTLKGGGGSGDVECRFFVSCEKGLENAGFEIVSKDWMDEYPKIKEAKRKEFVDSILKEAENYKATVENYVFGPLQPEVEYDLPLDKYEADIAIYVIRRNSKENRDRQNEKGDILLLDSEVRDILYLNKKFKKFLLVLNVVGVIDLSPINEEVSNILLLSMLGVPTGDIFADIVLGKSTPSGKLATTWSKIEDYKFYEEYYDLHETQYKEGVYVGYRYFDSANVAPLYPFGHGLTYTNFKLSPVSFSNSKEEISVGVKVKNIGKYNGKEVVQLYVSPPQTNKDKPYQTLVAFKKTKELKPQEEETLVLKFKLRDAARYDEEKAAYILDLGNYILRVGNSSRNTKPYGYVNLNEDIITEQLENKGGKADFEDYKPTITITDDLTEVPMIKLIKSDIETKKAEYNYKHEVNEELNKLSDEDLVNLCIQNFTKEGEEDLTHVVGAAGETTLRVKDINKYLVLADGPAGIRLMRIYGKDEKGYYRLSYDTLKDILRYFVTKEEWAKVDAPDNNTDRKGEVYYQYTTSIPIETAVAQSFNEDFCKLMGEIVANEMDIFGINLWLAPGLNIHRNIRCARNFEYFSEDPLITGKMAAAYTLSIQKHKNRGTTVKHFCCNNKEFNRYHNNSILSERALREIYLRGFEIAIKESHPYALMTSYNLLNGTHASERKDLIVDVLRSEWGFKGVIMSDWYYSGEFQFGVAKYDNQFSTSNIKQRNNLQMGGKQINYENLMKGIKEGLIDRQDLLENASIVYNTIEALNK